MENQQIFPEFKNEDVVGVIKYVGDKAEFLNFAKDLAIKIYDPAITVDPKENPMLHLYRTTAYMYIMGTVKGVDRFEIIFVKHKLADGKQRENAGTVG